MEGVGLHARGDPGHHVVAHGFPSGLAAHAIEIIVDVEDDGQGPLALRPQGLDLVHGSHHEALPHGAAGDGTVADVAHHYAFLIVAQFVEGRAHGDGAAAAYDGVVGIDAQGGKEGVHGAAQALIEAVFPGKGLAHHAIKQEVDALLPDGFGVILDHVVGLAPEEFLHDLLEGALLHHLDGAQALGQDLPVAPVGAEGVIRRGQVIGFPHIGRLLADAQVGGAGMGIGDPLVFAGGFDQVEHGLKFPDIAHIPIDMQKVLRGEVAKLVLDGLLIYVDRDLREPDGLRRAPRCLGVHKQGFGHGYSPLYKNDGSGFLRPGKRPPG